MRVTHIFSYLPTKLAIHIHSTAVYIFYFMIKSITSIISPKINKDSFFTLVNVYQFIGGTGLWCSGHNILGLLCTVLGT